MAYELTKADGTTLVIIETGTVDDVSSSLTFVGKNVVNYGEIQNENFLRLLENFAYNTEPPNKIRGQLWFDTGNNTLKVYNDTIWKTLATVSISSTSTTATGAGDLWFNSTSKQLYLNNGASFDLIGPENAADATITRFKSETIKDSANIDRAVIKCYIQNQVIAIISTATFTIGSVNPVPGFSGIVGGITWKNAPSTNFQSVGYHTLAEQANKLLNRAGDAYIIADTGAVNSTIVQRDSSGTIFTSRLQVNNIQAISTASIILDSSLSTLELKPQTDGVSNLGAEDKKYNQIHSNAIFAIAGNMNIGTINTLNAGAISFSSLSDENNTSVTSIDTVLTNASDHTSLATKKAIKDYIDSLVQTEVQARIDAINTLSNRLDLFGFPIPVGTVVYVASSSVPQGWLECAGQLLDKEEYPALYAVLGSQFSYSQYLFRNIDLRGEFIRGWDHGRGADNGRSNLTAQGSQNLEHGHLVDDIRFSEIWDATFQYNDPMLGPISVGPGAGSRTGLDYDNGVYFFQHGTYKSGGNESRPRNVSLMPIIKY